MTEIKKDSLSLDRLMDELCLKIQRIIKENITSSEENNLKNNTKKGGNHVL